ncbi:hypothetical protein ACFQ0T_23215 [Kitasatospora gansuensis]
MLVAVAALLALVLWLVTGPGGDGKSGQGKVAQPAPAQSITPGADPTGPAITTRPGGSGGSTATGGVSGSGGGEVSLTTGGTGPPARQARPALPAPLPAVRPAARAAPPAAAALPLR